MQLFYDKNIFKTNLLIKTCEFLFIKNAGRFPHLSYFYGFGSNLLKYLGWRKFAIYVSEL